MLLLRCLYDTTLKELNDLRQLYRLMKIISSLLNLDEERIRSLPDHDYRFIFHLFCHKYLLLPLCVSPSEEIPIDVLSPIGFNRFQAWVSGHDSPEFPCLI